MWLEGQLGLVLDEQVAGKTLTSAGAGDVSSGFTLTAGNADRKRQILWDLYQLDPTDYPLSSLPQTRTTAIFRDS